MTRVTETTDGIAVSVQPMFVEERSDMVRGLFFFAYFITISNSGTAAVQLLKRRWNIRDSAGPDYEVGGEGVVGRQPVIQAGGTHFYNSFCILKSFEGSMEGNYLMTHEDGSSFEVVIPKFHLRARCN